MKITAKYFIKLLILSISISNLNCEESKIILTNPPKETSSPLPKSPEIKKSDQIQTDSLKSSSPDQVYYILKHIINNRPLLREI